MAAYSLYIINKSGGLVFGRDYAPDMVRADLNDALRLASTWHSLHAIAAQLSPVPGCAGIELLASDAFELHCLQTLTGARGGRRAAPRPPFL